MIRRVTVKNFKRFKAQSFDLADAIILAGPNNAGKSTLLQAIVTWKYGLDRWNGLRRGSGALKRSGVAITRADFTAVPLREMNLLWEDRRVTGDGERPGARRLIEIELEGQTANVQWICGLEFEYQGPEQIYVRPKNAKNLDQTAIRRFPADPAANLQIVHVPPLSGIERDEPRRERGMQDLLVGQGRPGEILRNLLWEIWQRKDEDWSILVGHLRDLFNIEVLDPAYSPAQPFIVCEYREPSHDRSLDLSNAGSGTLQVLLILAFLYARPATVILLDEPDAHQHIILQKQVYELVRKVARDRGGQIVVATHSEVVLDATEPSRVLGFFGAAPRTLGTEGDRNQLREALKRITTTDLLLGREIGSVLYVEGETDERFLHEWAKILGHGACRFLDRPFVHWLRGRKLREAREHFFAMRAAFPDLRAVCLLDGDNRDEPDDELDRAGLVVLRWRRYEVENYLLQPAAIARFLGLPVFQQEVEREFRRQVPEGTDLFGDHAALVRTKGSEEFLVPLFEALRSPVLKKDLYLLAAKMEREEIHPEVREKLDRIAAVLCPGQE